MSQSVRAHFQNVMDTLEEQLSYRAELREKKVVSRCIVVVVGTELMRAPGIGFFKIVVEHQ